MYNHFVVPESEREDLAPRVILRTGHIYIHNVSTTKTPLPKTTEAPYK